MLNVWNIKKTSDKDKRKNNSIYANVTMKSYLFITNFEENFTGRVVLHSSNRNIIHTNLFWKFKCFRSDLLFHVSFLVRNFLLSKFLTFAGFSWKKWSWIYSNFVLSLVLEINPVNPHWVVINLSSYATSLQEMLHFYYKSFWQLSKALLTILFTDILDHYQFFTKMNKNLQLQKIHSWQARWKKVRFRIGFFTRLNNTSAILNTFPTGTTFSTFHIQYLYNLTVSATTLKESPVDFSL